MRALLVALPFTFASAAAAARVLPISLEEVERTIIACHMSLRIDPPIRFNGPPATAVVDWVRAASLRAAPLHGQPGADRQAVQAGVAMVVSGRTLAIYADEFDHGDEARQIETTQHFDAPQFETSRP